MSYRDLLGYVLGISVVRGLVMPDFRYGLLSIIVIRVVYPMTLLLPLLFGKGAGYWEYLLVCVAGIGLSVIVAIGRYVGEFGGDALDALSLAIHILSFVAMTAMLACLLAFAVWVRNGR